ncbi:MAG: ribosome maturation factor RimM [Reyranellaceae bacterium]
MAPKRVLVGIVVGAQGVRGRVRIKSFTEDPMAIGAYGAPENESGGRRFAIRPVGMSRGAVLADIEGVADRNAAEALKGTRLYVERSALGETEEGEYFHADLIGLAAEDGDGRALGRVKAVFDFGAGPLLELERTEGGTELVAFSDAVVPVVDLAGGRIVVHLPAEVEAGPEAAPQGAKRAARDGSDVAG